MKLNSRICLLLVALLALTAVLPSAGAQPMYAPTLKVGGGFDSAGDGGLTTLPNGDTYSNGKGVFLDGVESYGGFLQADVAFKYNGTQVGLFTGGGSSTAGSLLLNGVMFVTAATDWGSFAGPASGMSAGLSIEDTFGYGARPQLSLIGTDAEGLRLHYDLANVTTADLYDESADSTFRIENSDGTRKANLSVEGVATIGGDTAYLGSPGPSDFLLTCPQGDLTIQAKSGGELHLRAAGSTTLHTTNHGTFTSTGLIKAEGNAIDVGDAGGFSGVKFNPAATTLDFWIDGVKVAHISSNGTYTDDVP